MNLDGAGLVTEFDEMRKVAGDVTFVPGDQDRVAHLVVAWIVSVHSFGTTPVQPTSYMPSIPRRSELPAT